jgi:hypothetical protein
MEYYKKAVEETNLVEKEKHLAYTYIALGHIMHLIQDMTVLEHVKNEDKLV